MNTNKSVTPSMSVYLTTSIVPLAPLLEEPKVNIVPCTKNCTMGNYMHMHFEVEEEKTKPQKQWKCTCCGHTKLISWGHALYNCTYCKMAWSRAGIQEVMKNEVFHVNGIWKCQTKSCNNRVDESPGWCVDCLFQPHAFTRTVDSKTFAVDCKVPNCTTCLPKTPPPAPVKLGCKCPIISFGIQHVDGCIDNPTKKA